MNERRPKIAVLGSLNRDLVIPCEELPAPGQTVLASALTEFWGGKGANQAAAAALAGGDVAMIGAVGDDDASDRMIDNLVRRGVNCDAVLRRAGQVGGTAIIAVDAHGQNFILVVSGANATLTAADVSAARATIERSAALLVQLEIPLDAVRAGVEIARNAGVRVILDPAPAPTALPPELLAVDLLCPNETEAAALTGLPVRSPEDAALAAERLRERGARQVAVTLGGRGALLHTKAGSQIVPAFEVNVVDSTAAGDAFAGALAVHWAATNDLAESVLFANAAGALAASAAGAQDGLASADAIRTLWKSPR